MRISFLALPLLLLCGCVHMGTVAQREAAARTGVAAGYAREGEQVTFKFTPSEGLMFSSASAGGLQKLEAAAVRSVAVAGPFNQWDAAAWPLTRQADGSWTLSKPAGEIGRGDVSFKFVVNGEQWVEPPDDAPNVEDNGVGNGGMNLYIKMNP